MPPIYTKTGDAGDTGLLGKVRVSKADPRIEAIGAVDELNATIGIVRAKSKEQGAKVSEASSKDERANLKSLPRTFDVCPLPFALDQWLADLQSLLFSVGAELAAPNGGHEDITDQDVTALEQQIDAWTAELPPLDRFILPGGSPTGAELHRARAVCRRAERALVNLNETDPDRPLRPELLQFLNRLSDVLFTAARWVNHCAGIEESIWQRNVQ